MEDKKWYLITELGKHGDHMVYDSRDNMKMTSAGGKLTSISVGYGTEAELREREQVVDWKCSKCGGLVRLNYHGKDSLIENRVCISCSMWQMEVSRSKNRVVIDGQVYRVGGYESNPKFAGHGGREFKIRVLETGEIITTNNLWHSGRVPEVFKGDLPDDAEFVSTPETEEKRIGIETEDTMSEKENTEQPQYNGLHGKLKRPLVCFDLETTGVDVSRDQIVQIAMVKLHPNGERGEFTSLVKPQRGINPEAEEKHGITMEMLKDAPSFGKIAETVLDFMDGADLTGYNIIKFDFPLLRNELKRVGKSISAKNRRLFCTYKMTRKILSWKLEDTYKLLTGKTLEGAHDALNDVEAALEIAGVYVSDHSERVGSNIGDWEKFGWDRKTHVDWEGYFYRDEEGVVRFIFGKHRDKPVLQHKGYLEWMLQQDFPEDTLVWVKHFLNQ